MATFKELVSTTRLLAGMQGTGPSSVETATGVEEVLVRFVRDAYIDCQNLRENFNFLENTKTFSTTATKSLYTLLEIFGITSPNIKKFKPNSFYITDSNGKKSYLRELQSEVLEARYLNDDSQKLPTEYTIEPPNKEVILKPIPDGVYTVSFRYYERPEILLTDAQIPKMPLSFHNLIIYKALEKMAVYLNAPSLFQEYSTEAARMQGQLMRMELKKMRMKTGALV